MKFKNCKVKFGGEMFNIEDGNVAQKSQDSGKINVTVSVRSDSSAVFLEKMLDPDLSTALEDIVGRNGED